LAFIWFLNVWCIWDHNKYCDMTPETGILHQKLATRDWKSGGYNKVNASYLLTLDAHFQTYFTLFWHLWNWVDLNIVPYHI
jgi:hypothetical protein